ncbi:ankyrin repeat-containing domain protein, partial [Syncephalis pseudoplumigaleata]
TPLMAAAYRGHAHLVPLLLAHGAQTNERDQRDRSALWLAAEQGHVQVVQALLHPSHDTDVNLPDRDGASALHVALRRGHVEVVRALL